MSRLLYRYREPEVPMNTYIVLADQYSKSRRSDVAFSALPTAPVLACVPRRRRQQRRQSRAV